MGEVTVKVPRLRQVAGRYFWRPTRAVKALGFANEALGDDLPKAIKRAQELNAEVKRVLTGNRPVAVTAGSLAALIRSYQESEAYKALRKTTRRQYDSTLRLMDGAMGRVDVAGIEPEDVEEAFIVARDNRGHAAAVNDVRLFRILFDHAIAKKMRAGNPAKQIKIAHPEHRKRIWTPEEFEALTKAALDAGRPSIALAALLALELAQRVSDVLALTWTSYQGGVFFIRQQKTGNRVAVPASQRLKRALKGRPRTSTHLVVSETTGQPYKKDWFKHEFARIRGLAGLDDQEDPPTFHDLRRTGLTELGEASGTEDELRAVGGISRDTTSIYVQATPTMAGNAIAKRDAARTKAARSGKNRRRR